MPDPTNNLIQSFLEGNAAARPDKVALVCGPKRFTYAQLDAMANRLANALREGGVRRGDRAVVYLPNSLETIVAMFAILKADAAFVLVNRTMKADKLLFILNNCQAAALIGDARALAQGIDERLLAEVKSLRAIVACGKGAHCTNGLPGCIDFGAIQKESPAYAPQSESIDLDLACLIYTSGTTGESKGVISDHSNVVFVTKAIVQYLKNNAHV